MLWCSSVCEGVIMKVIILAILMANSAFATEHKMKCVDVGDLRRCENDEAICYKALHFSNGGVSCYFKQTLIVKDSVDALNNTTITAD